MSSLLVLLALLSVATLAARRGAMGEILGGSSTLVPVVFGLVVGPGGLGFLAPSVVAGLGPALAVAVCLLGLVAGLRAGAPIEHEPPDRRALVPVVILALVAAALWVRGRTVGPALDVSALAAAALLAAACMGAPASTGGEARYAKVVALALAAFAMALVDAPVLAVVIGLGVVGAAVVILVGGRASGPTLVAALGAITMVAGASLARGAPGVLAGVAAGAVLARSRVGAVLSPLAERAERPLRMVVAVLVAASVRVDLDAAVTGVVLAAIAIAAAAATLGATKAARSDAYASSSLALALTASLTATGVAASLLVPLVLAVALADGVALAGRLALRRASTGV